MMALVHNVFPLVTNPEWIPATSIHNGNKYPTDLEKYFQNGNRFRFIWIPIVRKIPNQLETVSRQNGNCFHLIWILIQKKFPNQLEIVSKRNGNRFHFGNIFPNQMETVSILEIVSKPNGSVCFHFGYFLGVSKMD